VCSSDLLVNLSPLRGAIKMEWDVKEGRMVDCLG